MFGNDPEVADMLPGTGTRRSRQYLSYKDFIIEKSVNAIVA